MVVVDRAYRTSDAPENGYTNDARFAIPREVHTSEVTHSTIPVYKMSSVSADSATCITRPVVGVGRAGANDIRRIGGGVIDRLKVDSDNE